MAASIKNKIYPSTELGIVQDTSKSVTIQYYPNLELVLITATAAAGGATTQPLLTLMGIGS